MSRKAESHYSGVLVMAGPGMLDACAEGIAALSGAEVYLRDERAGRLIAVLESATTEGQESLMKRIREIAGVHAAALVYHYVDTETSGMHFGAAS